MNTRSTISDPSKQKKFDAPKKSTTPQSILTLRTTEDPKSYKFAFQGSSPVTLNRSGILYEGFLGKMSFGTKSKTNYFVLDHRGVVENHIIPIRPSFMKYALEIRMNKAAGQIWSSLSTYPVMSFSSPTLSHARDLCQTGDNLGLRKVFSDGRLSPLTVDENGFTLLYVRSSYVFYYEEQMRANRT